MLPCQPKPNDLPPTVETIKKPNAAGHVVTVGATDGIFKKITLNRMKLRAVIDTGSRCSLIDAKVSKWLNITPMPCSVSLQSADLKPLTCVGTCKLELAVSIDETTKIAKIDFVIVENLCTKVLIGHQVLSWFKMRVSNVKKEVFFEDAELSSTVINQPKAQSATLQSDEILPPRSETVVTAFVEAEPGCTLITTPYIFTTSVAIANKLN